MLIEFFRKINASWCKHSHILNETKTFFDNILANSSFLSKSWMHIMTICQGKYAIGKHWLLRVLEVAGIPRSQIYTEIAQHMNRRCRSSGTVKAYLRTLNTVRVFMHKQFIQFQVHHMHNCSIEQTISTWNTRVPTNTIVLKTDETS